MTEAPDGKRFAYDEVAYPIVVASDLTPDRLRAIGLMRGWEGPDPTTASYLEIGCGSGINATAVGAAWPQTRCVGFDLARSAIEEGQALVKAARLDNVDLHVGDILTYPRDGEKFDYIACHGVLAWVPEPVRHALIELIGARLAPGGVAYLGYDCLPTASVKAAINRFLISQVAHIADPAKKVDRAMEIAAILADTQHEQSRFKTVLQHLAKEAPTYTRSYVYHDWLAEYYAPQALADVAREAATHGLKYHGDVSFSDMFRGDFIDEGIAILETAGDDLVARNTTADLLRGTHSFRMDLYVRADAPPPPAQGSTLDAVTYSLMAEREEGTLRGEPAIIYEVGHLRVTVAEPHVQKVLDGLLRHWPAELTREQAIAASGLPAAVVDEVLGTPKFLQLITRHATPQPFVVRPGDKPRAGRLARAMAADGTQVVSPRHHIVVVEEDPSRLLLALSNGERTRAEIGDAINQVLGIAVTAEQVDAAIADLAKRRLFEA